MIHTHIGAFRRPCLHIDPRNCVADGRRHGFSGPVHHAVLSESPHNELPCLLAIRLLIRTCGQHAGRGKKSRHSHADSAIRADAHAVRTSRSHGLFDIGDVLVSHTVRQHRHDNACESASVNTACAAAFLLDKQLRESQRGCDPLLLRARNITVLEPFPGGISGFRDQIQEFVEAVLL